MTTYALPNSTRLVDPQEVRRSIKTLIELGAVFEIRILDGVIDNPRFPATYAGYFRNTDEGIVTLLKQLMTFKSFEAVYFTAQVVNPRLITRINQVLKKVGKEESTKDSEVDRYRLLLIDVDPDRPAKTSSTDAEHDAAIRLCQAIEDYLSSKGFPLPTRGDSSNGGHLEYFIDLPNTPQNSDLIARFLKAIHAKFDKKPDDGSLYLKVDTTVYNASRIWKLYGTRACKGSNSPDYDSPHRMARLLYVPDELVIAQKELIESIALPIEEAKTSKPAPKYTGSNPQSASFDGQKFMDDFIKKYGIEVKSSEPHDGGTRYHLAACVWNGHTDNSATLFVRSDGSLGANCNHDSCEGLGWKDFRRVFEPNAYDKRDPWANTNTYSLGNQQPELETIIQRLGENEYGDGLLFAQVFNGQVCHDHSEKAWYLWNEHHWKKDVTGKIKQMVSGHLGSIYLKARGDVHKQIVDIQAEIDKIQRENSEDERLDKLNNRLAYLTSLMEALEKRARALRGANRMKNVLTFAMSEHNIGITGEMWDTDPWLLGVSNGVINLHTGELRDGYPIDYIRSISPTEWKGLNEPCPRFDRFWQEIFEVLPEAQLQKLTGGKFRELSKEEQERIIAEHRKKLIEFLQRLFGYAMTGLVTEHIFPLFYGEEGRNGKDTLFTLLKVVLGTAIANAVSNDVFLSADRGRSAGSATPHLTDLQGKRIVWGSETKQGDRINVSQVKQLTGGGGIPARPPYGFQYTFDPTHTLFLMTNYKPHADAKDKAFWSRACLIEFCLRFVDKPQGKNERKADTSLSKDLEAEASGILAFLVRGCLKYQEQGLNRPEIVEIATESYRVSEDNIQHFIDECCVCNEKAHVGAKRLYDTYVTWCKDNNLNHINGKLFGEDMSKRFVKVRRGTGLEYQKIGICVDDTPPEGPFDVGSKFNDVGSNSHPTYPAEAASEAVSSTFEETDCVGCVGLIQEVSHQLAREDVILPFYGNTLHTLHTSNEDVPFNQPVEPIEGTVKGQESPYTNGFDPTLSLETFWSIGKTHGYPEMPDLDLKAGKIGWNSFSLAHRLRIPDVIKRFAGSVTH